MGEGREGKGKIMEIKMRRWKSYPSPFPFLWHIYNILNIYAGGRVVDSSPSINHPKLTANLLSKADHRWAIIAHHPPRAIPSKMVAKIPTAAHHRPPSRPPPPKTKGRRCGIHRFRSRAGSPSCAAPKQDGKKCTLPAGGRVVACLGAENGWEFAWTVGGGCQGG